MTMPAPTWFEQEPHELRRWAIAAAVVIGIHAAALVAYTHVGAPAEIGDDDAPISMDFSPGQDTVNQAAVDPTPEPPPPEQVEQPPPPPPHPPEAVALPEPPPAQKVEQQEAPLPPQQQRIKSGSPLTKRSWATAVSKHLAQHMARYPRGSISRDEEGVVHVGFRIDRAGRISELHVLESSGHHDLDNAVLKMVEDAQPFPPLPDDISESENVIDFPFRFGLH
jgi:periplasmic protein TonB